MTEDMLVTSQLTYKELTKTVKMYCENSISKADLSDPFNIDNGISAVIFYVLQDSPLIDCNVLGYKYTDNTNIYG